LLYIPSAYLIETRGIKFSVTLGIALTAIGLWLNYGGLASLGIVPAGMGMPFVLNTFTKAPAIWYGPRGRLFVTGLFLLT